MRLLVCGLVILALMGGKAASCFAQQPGPATLENLVNSPDRAPLPPLAKDSEQPFPLIAPDAAAVKEAQDLIKQAYEDDYKASATNPEPLIQKMLAAAGQTKDPVRRYAYLISAEEAAVSGGDYGRTMELIDIRAAEFAIDGLQSQLERLAEFLTPKTKTDPESLTRLYEYAIETAERGVKQDSLEQAKAAAEMAASIAKSLYMTGKAKKKDEVADDGAAKQTQARALVKHIERRSGLFSEYQKALETIKTKEDPAANGVIGRYLCFEIDDWEKGLPFLAKGDQKDVAEVAALELEVRAANAKKPNAADIFTIAGEWWKVTEDVAESGPTPTKSHAAALYRSVRESLTDPLDQALAEKRGNDPAIGRMNLGRPVPGGKSASTEKESARPIRGKKEAARQQILEVFIGRWRHSNGNSEEFRADGAYINNGDDKSPWSGKWVLDPDDPQGPCAVRHNNDGTVERWYVDPVSPRILRSQDGRGTMRRQ